MKKVLDISQTNALPVNQKREIPDKRTIMYTVEGNSNDVCMKKWYAAGDKVIMGYGLSFA